MRITKTGRARLPSSAKNRVRQKVQSCLGNSQKSECGLRRKERPLKDLPAWKPMRFPASLFYVLLGTYRGFFFVNIYLHTIYCVCK